MLGGALSLSDYSALQNLAWLDENGKVHKNSESPNLQHLAWLDEDGNIHKNSEWKPKDLQNLSFLGKDGKVHKVVKHHVNHDIPMLGANAPLSLQNLSQNVADIQLGNTEYALISLWFVFTAIVFGLLYKITKEAVSDEEEIVEKKKTEKHVKVEYLDESARESFV